jgi:hypothetical protein
MSLCKSFSFGTAVALPVALLLSACGGSGNQVVTIPPPPPLPSPTPAPSVEVQTSLLASPATKAGTYDLIGLVNRKAGGTSTSQFTTDGQFRLAVAGPDTNRGFTYTLNAPSNFLPVSSTKFDLPVPLESWDFNPGGTNFRYEHPYGDTLQFFGENLKEYEVSADGTKTLRENYDYSHATFQNAAVELPSGQAISESLVFDVGLSYVAMGEWSWEAVTVNGDGTVTPSGDSNSIYFAYGSRTPASGIPASGTATFDARTLGASSASLPFSLTADFGKRSISTEISQPSVFAVSGSAPFDNSGSFDIPLTGSAGAQAASGNMDGAFFGPHAEQVGGVVSVGASQGPLFQDAFVGQQHH